MGYGRGGKWRERALWAVVGMLAAAVLPPAVNPVVIGAALVGKLKGGAS